MNAWENIRLKYVVLQGTLLWEAEAVEEGLDIAMLMSRPFGLIGMDPAKGRQGSARLP
jgi:hypothetical protein